jgi:hypothetical protein
MHLDVAAQIFFLFRLMPFILQLNGASQGTIICVTIACIKKNFTFILIGSYFTLFAVAPMLF